MKILSLIVVMFFPLFVYGQAPNFVWGVKANSESTNSSACISIDSKGNVFIGGVFTDSVSFGGVTVFGKGGNDIFLVKYNTFGQFLWVKTGGSVTDESISSIITDSTGDIYVTGSFGKNPYGQSIAYDTAYFSNETLISKGDEDVFIAKYDSSGNLTWIKNFGSHYNDYGTSVTLTHSGKILLVGSFCIYNSSPPVIDTINFGGIMLSSNGHKNTFIIEFDSSGNILGANAYSSGPIDIGVDSMDNIYLTGYFTNRVVFGNDSIFSVSSGFVVGDIFLAKFDSSFHIQWIRQIGGVNSGSNSGGSLTVGAFSISPSGNIYITGSYFNCSLKFHDFTTLNYENQSQIFLVKYATDGTKIWAQEAGWSSWDYGHDIWIDEFENAYITGSIHQVAAFGNDTVIDFGSDDAYITKYDKNGNYKWFMDLGGTGDDVGMSLTGDRNGSLYVNGYFNSNKFYLGNDTLYNYDGYSSFFLTKISEPMMILASSTISPFVIYPNPTNGTVYIKGNKENFTSLKVFDQLGRVVEEQSLQQHQTAIDVHQLSDGIYYLQLKGKGLPVTKKIMIQH